MSLYQTEEHNQLSVAIENRVGKGRLTAKEYGETNS
jgi:hypothetical protein